MSRPLDARPVDEVPTGGDHSVQLVLEIPGWEPVLVTPTASMRRGEQGVFQCSWCGTVVVVSSLARTPLGRCPAKHDQPTSWWKQTLPVAGLSIASDEGDGMGE